MIEHNIKLVSKKGKKTLPLIKKIYESLLQEVESILGKSLPSTFTIINQMLHFFLLLLTFVPCIEAFAPNQLQSIARQNLDQIMEKFPSSSPVLSTSTAVGSIFLTPSVATAFDTLDDVEVAELPPVYVPILFAIAIMIGVGVLTSSLGDVYTEEASLGLMSGAKAKKERERSRSSYFKRSD